MPGGEERFEAFSDRLPPVVIGDDNRDEFTHLYAFIMEQRMGYSPFGSFCFSMNIYPDVA
jgi:hypothetical protein